jgi:uncharacterized protein
MLELPTPHGPARVELDTAAQPAGALVLGHGAGGGIRTSDLAAATHAARTARFTTALVEQPYRVAGRRSSPPARQLDAAWLAVVAQLKEIGALAGAPLVVGGRSAGARVACRTAVASGASAVLCLAFPVHPPGRGEDPDKSRLPELDAVELPVLVVQGDHDPFGMPPPGPQRTVVQVPGDHSLRSARPVEETVARWLGEIVG